MVTIKDIAKEAGVTHATVSYVLSGKNKASRRTSEKILSIADRLGYCRDEIAHAVVTGKTNVFGFLVPEATSEPCARLLSGIMLEAYDHNFVVKVIHAKRGCSAQNIAKICRGQQLAGLISYCFSNSDREFLRQLFAEISCCGIPLAVAAGSCDIGKGVKVLAGNIEGGGLAFRHLYSLGHRSFLAIQDISCEPWAMERLEGFLQAAREAGITIPESAIIRNAWTELKSRSAHEVRSLVVQSGATAAFCVTDYSALLLLSSLATAGVRVPEEMAVVGYGNLSFCDSSRPTITSIEENLAEIGRRTVRTLLQNMASDHSLELETGHTEVMTVELVARESTCGGR